MSGYHRLVEIVYGHDADGKTVEISRVPVSEECIEHTQGQWECIPLCILDSNGKRHIEIAPLLVGETPKFAVEFVAGKPLDVTLRTDPSYQLFRKRP